MSKVLVNATKLMSRNPKNARAPRRTPALRLSKRTRNTTVLRPARLAKSTRRNVTLSSPAPAKPAAPVATSVPRDADLHSANPHVDNREMPTSLSRYMRDAVQEPLLTVQEEIQLAARIKRGDDAARDRMIRANLRLVVKIAREYEGLGLPLLDLINEGNIGLMKAVERFAPAKGGKLSTYGAWWIKQSIRRALTNQSKTIRLPVHVVDKLFHLRRTTVKLQELLGREPTDSELADELATTADRIAELRRSAITPAPLDANLGNDEDSNRLADVVADENAENPYREYEEKTNCDMVRRMVLTLNPREATILRYRFGLDGDDEKTLEEVGMKFGVTRERIRQIQEIALRKLRNKINRLERMSLAA